MLIGLGLSGMPFCGADVGGFHGNTTGELLVRWYQLAAFYPFLRNHCHKMSVRQEPWQFGEPFLTYIKEALELRYRLIPTLYTLMYEASQTGHSLGLRRSRRRKPFERRRLSLWGGHSGRANHARQRESPQRLFTTGRMARISESVRMPDAEKRGAMRRFRSISQSINDLRPQWRVSRSHEQRKPYYHCELETH